MNNTFEAPNDYRNYLQHHGVKGMHWGIRHDKPSTGKKKRKSILDRIIGETPEKRINDWQTETIKELRRRDAARTKTNQDYNPELDGFEKGTKYESRDHGKFHIDSFEVDGAYSTIRGDRTIFNGQSKGALTNKQMADIQKALLKFDGKINYKMTESIAKAMSKDETLKGTQAYGLDPGAIMETIFESGDGMEIRYLGGTGRGNLQKMGFKPGGIGIEFTTGDGGLVGNHILTQEAVFYPQTGDLKVIDPNYFRMDG